MTSVYPLVELVEEIRVEGEKGGPGSGHWGHAGRPGSRGGSTPGKMSGLGQVSRAFFDRGPGRKIIADLPDNMKEQVIGTLTETDRIQSWHLRDLNRIDEFGKNGHWPTEGDDSYTLGIYCEKDRSIYLRPTATFDLQEGVQERLSENVLAHELGHHVAMTAARGGHQNVMMNRIVHAYSKAQDEIRTRIGELGQTMAQRPLDDFFTNMGMRAYSTSNPYEFGADAFMVYLRGTDRQRGNLAQFMGVKSLDEIFKLREVG